MKEKKQIIRIYSKEECEKYFKGNNIVSLRELEMVNSLNILRK